VGIDIAPRDASEEAELVASLSRELEATKGLEPRPELTDSQKKTMQEVQDELLTGDPGGVSKKRAEDLLQKMNEMVKEQMAATEKRQADRLLGAQRLACLEGDEAIRAKVHFIAEERESGYGESIGLILVNGLSSSRNKQLQLSLLEAAWRDPNNLPTYELQEALRAARELEGDGMAKVFGFDGSEEERKAALKQDQADLDVIIGTLPARSEANRTQTIEMLKKIAIPNPFNQGTKHP